MLVWPWLIKPSPSYSGSQEKSFPGSSVFSGLSSVTSTPHSFTTKFQRPLQPLKAHLSCAFLPNIARYLMCSVPHQLAPHRPWDCAIDLLPGAFLQQGRVYLLSLAAGLHSPIYFSDSVHLFLCG